MNACIGKALRTQLPLMPGKVLKRLPLERAYGTIGDGFPPAGLTFYTLYFAVRLPSNRKISYYRMKMSGAMRCMIVGASSGIGEAVAMQLGREGALVALIARRPDELDRVKGAIEAAGGKAFAYPHDVRDYSTVPALFQQIAHDLGGLDLVVYASGVMPIIEPNEYCFEKDRLTLEVNCLGAVAWLNEAAQRFEHAREGAIVGISSVAGDRGRRGFPVYGASKAFLDNYLESLRNRLSRFGVLVTTIKPGPVDTPMSREVKKRPLLVSAEAAAQMILKAVSKRKRVAYVPGTWRPIMFVVRSVPSAIFRKLNF